jgi:hypothetical protein
LLIKLTVLALQQDNAILPSGADIYGMAVRGRTIYYCTRNNGLRMLNLSDKSVSNIINSKLSYVCYVAIHLLSTPPDDTATLLLSLI